MQPGMERALELFDKAMETEREGIEFYEKAAAKAQDVNSREIFQMLAKAEQQHLSDIENAKEAIRYSYSSYDWKGDFVSEVGKEIEAIGRQYLPKLTGDIASAGALEAINMGIKLEQDSIAFYTDAKTKVTDLGVANLFGSLVWAEKVHLFILELGKDKVTGTKRA